MANVATSGMESRVGSLARSSSDHKNKLFFSPVSLIEIGSNASTRTRRRRRRRRRRREGKVLKMLLLRRHPLRASCDTCNPTESPPPLFIKTTPSHHVTD